MALGALGYPTPKVDPSQALTATSREQTVTRIVSLGLGLFNLQIRLTRTDLLDNEHMLTPRVDLYQAQCAILLPANLL